MALIVTVRRGSRGDAACALQQEFQFPELSVDRRQGIQIGGIFGPRTEAAVRAFQDAGEVEVDRIVGPLTKRALVGGVGG